MHMQSVIILLASLAMTCVEALNQDDCRALEAKWCHVTEQCVQKERLCNHIRDCPDNSDEQDCVCRSYEQKCHKGACMSKTWYCDGVEDCPHGDDERNCPKCSDAEFQCADKSACVEKSMRCDGEVDCRDGSDENNCFFLDTNSNFLQMVSSNTNEDMLVCAEGWSDEWAHKTCSYLGFEKSIAYNRKKISEAGPFASLSPSADLKKALTTSFEKNSKCSSRMVVKLKCLPRECGLRAVERTEVGRYVVNGDMATLGAWPWQVRIYRDGSFVCGGSLVRNKWVLTAAHCVYKGLQKSNNTVKKIENLEVKVGGLYLSKKNVHEQTSLVSLAHMHPSFNYQLAEYDIALLQLSEPVVYRLVGGEGVVIQKLSKYVRPVCLASTNSSTKTKRAYRVCILTGHGMRAKDLEASEHLLQARMDIMEQEECRRNYDMLMNGSKDFEKRINFKMMSCAGEYPTKNNINMCMGDSGGPLNCLTKDGRWEVFGVNSLHSMPGLKDACQATIHSRVDASRDWLKATMGKWA